MGLLLLDDERLIPSKKTYYLIFICFILIRVLLNLSKTHFPLQTNPQPTCKSGYGTMDELCKYHNINYDTHDVHTPDNYIVKMFNLKPKKFNSKHKTKGVALLIHGLMDSSDSYLVQDDPKSIP